MSHASDTAARNPRIVIIPCGGRKAETDTPIPAGDLYTGSYHRAARRAADRLAGPGGQVLILSALHGLVRLDEPLLPYELRAGQPGTVAGETLREQAVALGIADAPVTVLAGRAYVKLARQVWPQAAAPLEGTRGIGEQLARLAAIYNAPQAKAPAVGPVAARQAERAATRRAWYATADALQVTGGRARVRLTFPAAAGKGRARMAAAIRFAAVYGVTVEPTAKYELTAHGTPEQAARFASALPRLLDAAENYTMLAVKALGRWERHSSSAAHMAGKDAAELRALRRRFRAAAFEVVVETLLDPSRPVPAFDEAAPMWGQAALVAGELAEYGWFDPAERADAAEVAELLGAAQIDAEADALAVPAAALVGRVLPRRAAAPLRPLADRPRRTPRPRPSATRRGMHVHLLA